MLKQGTVIAFDAASWTATVRLDAAIATYQRRVPVASHLAGWMLPAGMSVALLVFDELVGDNVLIVAAYGAVPASPGCRAYSAAGQSIPTAAWTPVALDSERWDNGGMHDPAVNSSRLTVRTPGVYAVSGCVHFAAGAGASRGYAIVLNGSHWIVSSLTPLGAGVQAGGVISTLYRCDAGDYFELYCFQDTGAALALHIAPEYSPELAAAWVGV